MKKVFVNFSNHCSTNWGQKQIEVASQWGKIVDLPFPDVPANINEKEIHEMAQQCVNNILSLKPKAVMCQGEFTLAFAVVEMLKMKGITVLSACSNRKTNEIVHEDGNSHKTSVFEFVRFREY